MHACKNHIKDFTKLHISPIIKASEVFYESVRGLQVYLLHKKLDKFTKSIIRAPLVPGSIWNFISDQEKILSNRLKQESIPFCGRVYRIDRGNFPSLRRPRRAANPITKKVSKSIE